MRHLPAVMLALLSATVGCSFFGTKERVTQQRAASPFARPPAGDVVYLEVALVERPAGDDYLDDKVWESGDEQGMELDLKPALERNGLRVAQFGLLPDRLQSFLSSPRFCANPRRLQGEPEKPTIVPVGAPRASCSFRVVEGGETRSLELQSARCEFEVVPLPEEENRVRLRFTPRVRHGKPRMQPTVARDPDGQLRWAVDPSEPTEEFAALRFELVVGAGEYVALGTWCDRVGTLGHALFVPEGEKVQHLLVLRAARVSPEDGPAARAAPLALQAARTTARGAAR